MRQATNGQIVNALFIAVSNIFLVVKFDIFNSNRDILGYAAWAAIVLVIGALLSAVLQLHQKSRPNPWQQPASPGLRKSVANGVTALWLVAFAGILFLFAYDPGHLVRAFVTSITACLASWALGHYLSGRFATGTLLAYAVSSLGVLLLMLVGFVFLKRVIAT